MQTLQAKTINRPTPTVCPVRTPSRLVSIQCQPTLRVSSPTDPAEKEADSTAKRILRMPIPDQARADGASQVRRGFVSPYLTRFQDAIAQRPITRKSLGPTTVDPKVAAEINAASGSGSPLPSTVRGFMETRFRADFSNVRVHTGDRSARLNRQLNAQAFTVGHQVFFGKDRFRPENTEGRELIAHELTHTVQQGAVVQRSPESPVAERTTPQVHRLGLSDVLDYFAEKAYFIPGFRMFTILIGVNPINMSRVERSAANILRAIIEFIPGGALITQALDNHGVFEKVGAWVEEQFRSLGLTVSLIKDALSKFLDSLSWTDVFHLGSVWDRAKRIFTEPIDRIKAFVVNLVTGIVTFIKDAILRPLGKLAEGTRGYNLLKAVLGFDPVTGDPVPRTAETLIGGFMEFIGRKDIWENLKSSGALARAWDWFQQTLSSLLGFVREIPSLFVKAFRSLELMDIVLVPRAFAKILGVFGGFVIRFIRWGGDAVWGLLEIIFALLAPAAMPYLRRAAAAFRTILSNPIGFVGNLVRSAKLGFEQFAKNIGTHFKNSLIQWLTGSLGGAGVYIPKAFEIREIIKFVLSVLGLTWQNIRVKLVRVLGETAVKTLETGLDIVVTLVRDGPAAAWEKIKEQLTNLKEMVLEEIMSFVSVKIVQSAVVKLLSALNPAGAVIQAIIAIYNTVMFFIERISQIIQVATAFLNSIAAIAGGAIAAAAKRVEDTLAGLLTLAISFLARIAGLGKISDAVIKLLDKIRAPIDRALDKVVEWIVKAGKALLSRVLGGDPKAPPEQRLDRGLDEAVAAVNCLSDSRVGQTVLRPVLGAQRLRHNLRTLDAIDEGGRWIIAGSASPTKKKPSSKLVLNGAGEGSFQSRVTYDSPDSLRGGRRMVAMPLGKDNASRGGRPTDSGSPRIWDNVNKTRGGTRLYVRGHLLNEKLGGPGNTPANLTPITYKANREHEASVESTLKRMVLQENKWVYYKVVVHYPGSQRQVPPGVLPEEGSLATRLSGEWQEMRPRANKPDELEKVGSPTPVGPIENVPPYPQT